MVDGFAALLKRHGIQLTKGQPGTHARLGRLDRYHGTIRRQLGEIFAVRTSHVWVDVLQDLVDNHNTSPSRALDAAGKGTAPIDVARSATKEEMLRTADNKRAGGVRRVVDAMKITSGTQVWLLTPLLTRTQVCEGAATWTPELYSVIERVGPNTFEDVPAGSLAADRQEGTGAEEGRPGGGQKGCGDAAHGEPQHLPCGEGCCIVNEGEALEVEAQSFLKALIGGRPC